MGGGVDKRWRERGIKREMGGGGGVDRSERGGTEKEIVAGGERGGGI